MTQQHHRDNDGKNRSGEKLRTVFDRSRLSSFHPPIASLRLLPSRISYLPRSIIALRTKLVILGGWNGVT